MKDFRQSVKEQLLLYDGSKGAMLQSIGLPAEACAEEWNLSHPDKVAALHDAYIDAGSDIIQTNTFCANAALLARHGLADKVYDINYEGAKLALKSAAGRAMVAASVGPLGRIMQPAGDLSFEDAVSIFSQQLKPLLDAGVTIVNFETFMDLSEMRAAIIAADEMNVPYVISSMTFEETRTLSGNTPQACAITFDALGTDVMGANCSGGPASLVTPIEGMRSVTDAFLSVKPNAGLPDIESGNVTYKMTPEDFATGAPPFVANGVRLLGGCCGTTPVHIAALYDVLRDLPITAPAKNEQEYLCSGWMHTIYKESIRIARMELCNAELVASLKDNDFYALMDYLPDDAGESDALLLDFGGLDEDFDMWLFTASLGMFVKKPMLICGQNQQLVQQFLRYYCGRAAVIGAYDLEDYGALHLGGD